ncbi:MAG: F0F1 ATP synthase subunit delta [Dehalococcoidia bacterium]|nr:F0F1 ATP synthase subunit delta [Dehalococcoidia bacterium]
MADPQVGKRYAQAAFAVAKDQGAIAQWRSDLEDIATVLVDSAAAGLLSDTRIPVDRRLAMVDRTLDVQPLALNFARLLVSKGRAGDAREVARAFAVLADAHEGVVNAQVVTAVELSAGELQSIQERLSSSLGKTVRATASVDPGILGGMIVRVGDRLVDGSVRTRLRRLRRELAGAR